MLFEQTPARVVGAGSGGANVRPSESPAYSSESPHVSYAGVSTILNSPNDGDEGSPSRGLHPFPRTTDVSFEAYLANRASKAAAPVGAPGVFGPALGSVVDDAEAASDTDSGGVVLIDSHRRPQPMLPAADVSPGATGPSGADSRRVPPANAPVSSTAALAGLMFPSKRLSEMLASPPPLATSVVSSGVAPETSFVGGRGVAGGHLFASPPQAVIPNFPSSSSQNLQPWSQLLPSAASPAPTPSPFQSITPIPVGNSTHRSAGFTPDTADVRQQRAMLQQVAQELAARQQETSRRELLLQRREAALKEREQELETGLARLADERAKDAAALADRSRRELQRDDPAKDEIAKYRDQLRELHKELNARESEVDSLARELIAEREIVAKAKLQLDAREAAIIAQQEDHTTDTRRHANLLHQSSRALEDKMRVVEQRERDAERLHYEWDLKYGELQRRETELRSRETLMSQRERDLVAVFEVARGLELQAVQIRRGQERLDERERALWDSAAKASSISSEGVRSIGAIMEDVRGAKHTLDQLELQLPHMTMLSAV